MATQTRTTVVLATSKKGLSAPKVIELANNLGLVLAPNREFDRRLVKTDIWMEEREIYETWSGTLGAYGRIDSKLGQFIQYWDDEHGVRYTFEVPVEARGEKNVILAINHGFTAERKPLIAYRKDGRDRFFVEIADIGMIKILERFPTSDGWYLANNRFRIPLGKKARSGDLDARRLSRLDGPYIGLAVRDDGFTFYDRRYVRLWWNPSYKLGALAWKIGASAPEVPAQRRAKPKGETKTVTAAQQPMPNLKLIPGHSLGNIEPEIDDNILLENSCPFIAKIGPPEPIIRN